MVVGVGVGVGVGVAPEAVDDGVGVVAPDAFKAVSPPAVTTAADISDATAILVPSLVLR